MWQPEVNFLWSQQKADTPLDSAFQHVPSLATNWAETDISSVPMDFSPQFLCLPLISHLPSDLEHLTCFPDPYHNNLQIYSFFKKRYVIDLVL